MDEERIKEVGADRAAAEWLIRCGAAVKWTGSENYDRDYDSLVRITRRYSILAIDASDSSVSGVGFPHLKGLKHVREFIVERNPYLDDEALKQLVHLQDSLLSLRIVSCVNVTDAGIQSLSCLHRLRHLYLADLISVKRAEDCLRVLRSKLPDCRIESKVK